MLYNYEIIPIYLKNTRKKLNLSIQNVSSITNLSVGTISNIENAHFSKKAYNIAKLLNAYNINDNHLNKLDSEIAKDKKK